MTSEYVHVPLNQQNQSISGNFTLEKEGRIQFSGKEILYVVGMGIVDTSCCGMTGGRYALSPGFIVNWHYRKNKEGLWISEVSPVMDTGWQNQIRDLIKDIEIVSQVNFI